MENFKIIDGNISSPKGFLASGVHCGIKEEKKDLSIIYSECPAVCAAVFTKNKVIAAPLVISKKHIEDSCAQVIVVNSGNANACTGEQGMKDAIHMVELTSKKLLIPKENVIVSSTGIIGVPMPMEKVKIGIGDAVKALSKKGGLDSAEAILTTDKTMKKVGVELEIDGKKITIGAMAKGSRMIHPNMATMLSFLTTDANVEPVFFQNLLKEVTDLTYNMISVDGDTSTNDMVVSMANGLASNNEIGYNHPEKEKFIEAFKFVHEYLAKSIVLDGEGSSKFIEVEVTGSKTEEDAKLAVKSILNSNLVKTSLFGEQSNWGRILCSIGYCSADIDINNLDISIGATDSFVKMFSMGKALNYSKLEASSILKNKDLKILVNLNSGDKKAVGWGCDLSYDYVKINSAPIA